MLLAGVGWGTDSLRGRRASGPAANDRGELRPDRAAGARAGRDQLPGRASSPLGDRGDRRGGLGGDHLGHRVRDWYRALSGLSALQAATVQLTVPVIAALGGVAFLGERITLRLLGAGALVLGGIAVVIFSRSR